MQVLPDDLPPRPSSREIAVGVLRVGAVLVLLVVGTGVLLAVSLVPTPIRSRSPAERVAVALCRAFLWITGVELQIDEAEVLREHRGFVFFNHVSWLDPLVLVAAAPFRFLSTLGVRFLPFVGWMATALGTIYVNRGRAASREAARSALREGIRSSPTPVAIAPEGRIGPGPGVLPFRHGAFEVAADAEAPVLLVALQFEPRPYALWADGEWLARPLWRLCARTVPVVARVTPLTPALLPDAPASVLAATAERRMNEALGVGQPTVLTPPLPAR